MIRSCLRRAHVCAESGAAVAKYSPTVAGRWRRWRCRSSRGPRALPDHGVERIGEHPSRAAVEAAHVLEVAGLPQVLLY